MPFTKVGKDDYTSPSGRHFNGAQVRLWHAQGGKFPGQKGEGEMSYAKGHKPMEAHYAQGGTVLGRTRDFLKEPVEFRDRDEGERKSPDVVGDTADTDQKYGKSGAGAGKGMQAVPPQRMNKKIK